MASDKEMILAFKEAIAKDRYDESNHRAFADWLEENGYDDEAVIQREWSVEGQLIAESFMDEFLKKTRYGDREEYPEEAYGEFKSVEEMMEAAATWLDKGERHCFGYETPDELHGELVEAFWRHYQTLTGRPVAEDRRWRFFRCAC